MFAQCSESCSSLMFLVVPLVLLFMSFVHTFHTFKTEFVFKLNTHTDQIYSVCLTTKYSAFEF